MQKIGLVSQDPDDLLTKEFLQKYYKEFEYIVKYYENETRKRNFFKQKAVNVISKNVDVMKKIQEVYILIIYTRLKTEKLRQRSKEGEKQEI